MRPAVTFNGSTWVVRTLIGLLIPLSGMAQAPDDFRQDFRTAVTAIADNYAYFDQRATHWTDIPGLYAAELQAVQSRDQFVALMEQVVDELYDPHLQLNTNLAHSYRLVPSGTDLWAEWREGRAVITQVRDHSDAALAGLTAGALVSELDGQPIDVVVDRRLGRAYAHGDAAARDWALRSVLAGRHDTRRRLRVEEHGAVRTVELPATDQFSRDDALLESSEIRPGIGYIRLNDSLGNNALVPAFDAALAQLRKTRALIIDLRNTASGGNSSVARGVLGRFVAREQPYQKHVLPYEERESGVRRSWLELVSPRGDFRYTQPVIVLVNRWTGSMGEGLAIGFDATKAARVVGTAMADLVGATEHIALPHTGIGLNVPTERLYHVNGTPREGFVPPVPVDVTAAASGHDPFIDAALKLLRKP